jgi:hypothetical protein
MKQLRSSSLLACACLVLAACVETSVTDHAALKAAPGLDAARLGRTLLVVETALPDDDAARDAHATATIGLVRATLAGLPGAAADPDTEANLLARAKSGGFDSVLIVRVEDYTRHGAVRIGLAVPPVVWETSTLVSLRLRALAAGSGAVLADLRRDRVRGGLFTDRTEADLPDELAVTLRSLIGAG